MKQMAISEFKAKCLAVLETVGTSGEPLLVTRFGKPVAQINPPPTTDRKNWFGCMEGTAVMMDDLIEPTGAKWSALQK